MFKGVQLVFPLLKIFLKKHILRTKVVIYYFPYSIQSCVHSTYEFNIFKILTTHQEP